ncbi:DUF2711 family protein [Domibacillus robiginosus]|uniref:DUF2711 family protein n=1 Tax=Domibacillus robiginosus TaxID=1071054 RepID=UPI00067A9643|nr:DUF2711 family protein [Domibacillus robiginosus]
MTLLDYIHLDFDTPVLKQLPSPFVSAAFLLHPFVQMPAGWEQEKRKHPSHHMYPDDEEIIQLGNPVSWKSIMQRTGLASFEEVALALSDGWLHKKYAKPILAKKLEAIFQQDLYCPMEDKISIFLIEDILKVLASKGAEFFFYTDPIEEKTEKMNIKKVSPAEIPGLTLCEILLVDEKKEFAFISEYDAYTTLFLSKEENIHTLIKEKRWEAVICDSETMPAWFLPKE